MKQKINQKKLFLAGLFIMRFVPLLLTELTTDKALDSLELSMENFD